MFSSEGMAAPLAKKNIQQTIVVVVEQRYAASHSFKRVPTQTDTVPEGELDFRLIENVLELDRRLGLPRHIARLFSGSGSLGLRCLIWCGARDRSGQRSLGRKAGSSAQQAEAQLQQ